MKWLVVAGLFVGKQLVSGSQIIAQDIGITPDSLAKSADQAFAIALGVAFMWAVLTGRVRFHDEEDAKVRDEIRGDIRETKTAVESLVQKLG